MTPLPKRIAVLVFLAFAFTYFFSALIRAITATLSPHLTREFSLTASDLGLLAGGYFLGFAVVQLPLGQLLDRLGPKKVILGFLSIAVTGCVLFSLANSFAGLLIARVLCGVGLAACLMAPLTGYRRWLAPATQLRANAWMLMSGSLGMVASTLPVQWLLPVAGWRPLFWALAVLLLLSMAAIGWRVPAWAELPAEGSDGQRKPSYSAVWRQAHFRRLIPLGFINYGGMVALQTLWVVPWMIRVAGYTPEQAATGLFWLNIAMLGTFWVWGLLVPMLAQRGWHADRLIAWGTPLSLCVLMVILGAGDRLASVAAWMWALFCVSSTFMSLAQPAIGMAFPPELAGRALSAYNLVIFAGVFAVQWGIGLLIDAGMGLGLEQAAAFRAALAIHLLLSLGAYVYYLAAKRHNRGEGS